MFIAAVTLAASLANAPCISAAQAHMRSASLPFQAKTCIKDSRSGNVFYFDRVLADRKTFYGVRILRREHGFWKQQTQANVAVLNNGSLVLKHVTIWFYNAKGVVVSMTTSPEAEVEINT
jgi:hypothetical protein